MKLAFALLFMSSIAMAAVTPAQMREIRIAATDVMYEVGGEGRLNATVTRVNIIDELGSRVKVQFTYKEQMYPKRTCTFYYDIRQMQTVENSWLCEP